MAPEPTSSTQKSISKNYGSTNHHHRHSKKSRQISQISQISQSNPSYTINREDFVNDSISKPLYNHENKLKDKIYSEKDPLLPVSRNEDDSIQDTSIMSEEVRNDNFLSSSVDTHSQSLSCFSNDNLYVEEEYWNMEEKLYNAHIESIYPSMNFMKESDENVNNTKSNRRPLLKDSKYKSGPQSTSDDIKDMNWYTLKMSCFKLILNTILCFSICLLVTFCILMLKNSISIITWIVMSCGCVSTLFLALCSCGIVMWYEKYVLEIDGV